MDKNIEIYHNIIKYCFDNNYKDHVVKNGLELLGTLGYERNKQFGFNEKTNIYIYNIIKMISIMAYYIKEYKKIGFELSEYLVLSTEYTNKRTILKNEIYYYEKLKYKEMKNLNVDNAPTIKSPKYTDRTVYYPLNPSIIKTQNGYIANIRYVNYVLENDRFISLDVDRKMRSKNYIAELDKSLSIINSYELEDKSWISDISNDNIKFNGFEDIILFPMNENGSIWCSCTTNLTNPINIGKITLCKLEINENNKYEIVESYILKGPNGFDRVEKNWICINPTEIPGSIKFIYSHSPLHIVGTNIDENKKILEMTDVLKKEQSYDFTRFRGSSLPLYVSNIGNLSVIHEVIMSRENKRCYSHRFILYNNKWEIVRLSNPWYFHHIGIEFCRSICFGNTEDEILLAVGIRDNTSCLYKMDINIIHLMLHQL